jgi:purine-nucleoside phosphorylase
LATSLEDRVEIEYSDITGFGESTGARLLTSVFLSSDYLTVGYMNTVRGHQSSLAFGYLGKERVPVVAQLGRFHAYEGFGLDQVTYPMRIMKLLGIQVAIIT